MIEGGKWVGYLTFVDGYYFETFILRDIEIIFACKFKISKL